MRTTLFAACVLALVCCASPVFAQTPVPSPTPATTRIAFDHDGVNTDGYRLKIDGGAATALTPTCAVVNAVRTCEVPFPALTPGQHSLVITAWNIAGEADSAPFLVTVVVIPAVPTSIRIVVR